MLPRYGRRPRERAAASWIPAWSREAQAIGWISRDSWGDSGSGRGIQYDIVGIERGEILVFDVGKMRF